MLLSGIIVRLFCSEFSSFLVGSSVTSVLMSVFSQLVSPIFFFESLIFCPEFRIISRRLSIMATSSGAKSVIGCLTVAEYKADLKLRKSLKRKTYYAAETVKRRKLKDIRDYNAALALTKSFHEADVRARVIMAVDCVAGNPAFLKNPCTHHMHFKCYVSDAPVIGYHCTVVLPTQLIPLLDDGWTEEELGTVPELHYHSEDCIPDYVLSTFRDKLLSKYASAVASKKSSDAKRDKRPPVLDKRPPLLDSSVNSPVSKKRLAVAVDVLTIGIS